MGFEKYIEITTNDNKLLLAFPLFKDNIFKLPMSLTIPAGSTIRLFEEK